MDYCCQETHKGREMSKQKEDIIFISDRHENKKQ